MHRMLLSLLVLACLSCSKSANQPAGELPIYPLAIGNSWTYSVKYYNESGAIQNTATFTYQIDAIETIGGKEFFRAKDGTLFFTYIRNADNKTVEVTTGSGQPVFVFLKKVETTTVINSQQWPDNRGCMETATYTAYTDVSTVNGHESLHTVDSYTDCAGKEYERSIYYYKPHLGVVRLEGYNLKSNGTDLYMSSSADLTSYVLK